ncbi:MAG TPA: hypothetical protein VJJ82_03790 [Candidatus Nanoarchaeia archaeon]|nr:hypothetical protein [Candidatus Nanoarchaeia archaeon]
MDSFGITQLVTKHLPTLKADEGSALEQEAIASGLELNTELIKAAQSALSGQPVSSCVTVNTALCEAHLHRKPYPADRAEEYVRLKEMYQRAGYEGAIGLP